MSFEGKPCVTDARVAALAFSQRKVASCIIDMNLVELLQVLARAAAAVASNARALVGDTGLREAGCC
jgi:hypothetical protein